MTEHELQPIQTEADLFSVVEELERSVESLAASLEQVRSAVRQISSQIRELEPRHGTPPTLSVVEAAPLLDLDAEAIGESALGSFSWQSTAPHDDPEITTSDALAESAQEETDFDAMAAEAAREEVRKAVESTRAQLSWSNLRVDSGFGPAAPKGDDAHETAEDNVPLVESDDMSDQRDLNESRGEEVRLAVEQTRAGLAAAESEATDSEVEAEQARREEVRLAVERARADMAAAEAEQAAGEVDREEVRREEVRLAVERARVEMLKADEPAAAQNDDARREEVRRLVESTRHVGSGNWSEMKSDAGTWGQFKPEPGGFSIGPDQAPARPIELVRDDAEAGETGSAAPEAPADDEEGRREQVRRAVEAARSEMMGEPEPMPDRPRIVPLMPAPGAPTPKGADFNGPPVIVIEDPLGRVELSQVFATLSRVDRSAQAALLNYTPHSVTIGLNMLSALPDAQELALAAEAVFGRVCTVKSEGSRTAIEIGTSAAGS